jgi:hypothetical protein
VNIFTTLRYNLIRHSREVKAVHERAAIGVPPRNQALERADGLISGARHMTAPAGANQRR